MEYLRKKNSGIAYERTIKNVKTRSRKGLYEHVFFVYFMLSVFNINLCDFASLRSNKKYGKIRKTYVWESGVGVMLIVGIVGIMFTHRWNYVKTERIIS